MSETKCKIAVDEDTVAIIGRHATANGISASAFIAALIRHRDVALELDNQRLQIEDSVSTVPHSDVVRWLETWGTSTYRPWPKPHRG